MMEHIDVIILKKDRISNEVVWNVNKQYITKNEN